MAKYFKNMKDKTEDQNSFLTPYLLPLLLEEIPINRFCVFFICSLSHEMLRFCLCVL